METGVQPVSKHSRGQGVCNEALPSGPESVGLILGGIRRPQDFLFVKEDAIGLVVHEHVW